ncbi:MAG TPA: hypothetical protein VGN64_14860 [Dyadobacter sp.]|jgi:hypothetical protein|nr:hypothetical protein [Dyadobacter sp.]
MEIISNRRQDAGTVTGIFATKEDAEIAYNSLLQMGYRPDEIILMMSEHTKERFYNDPMIDPFQLSGCPATGNAIQTAIRFLGKFVAFPGVAMMVVGNLRDGGIRAMSRSVMSDKYAQFFRTRINEGEIVIDFNPHSVKERNLIRTIWEKCGGFPLVRRSGRVA